MTSNGNTISYGVTPDVIFVFKDTIQTLFAEKRRLVQVSDVFRKQFSPDFDNNKIMIEDISFEIFNDLLTFIFKNYVNITPDNYQEILYAATKYFIYQLIEKVAVKVMNLVTADNLLDVYENLGKYDIQSVNDHLRNICIEYPVEIIGKLNASSNAHMDILKNIMKSHILNCTEYELYVAVANMMEKASVDADDVASEMRKKLGSKLLRLIRFPVMTLNQVVLCGKYPSLLESQQIVNIALGLVQGIYTETIQFFSTQPRMRPPICRECKRCFYLSYCNYCRIMEYDGDLDI